VHSLLEAVLSVGRELDLPHVLRSIVEAAVVLVDAEYGALGVLGDDKKLSQFLTVGVTDEQHIAIGQLPTGHGLLGELIRHPQPLRLPDLSTHPASSGFPPNHPPMRSFLGVPIRVRDTVFGNLYLTEKRGSGNFDGEDEVVLSTLAVAAGVAIEKARLYEDVRRREQWLAASGEVTSRLLSGTAESEVLELILDRARENTDAELGVVLLPLEGGAELRGQLALGTNAEMHRGLVIPRDGTFAGAAFAEGTPIITVDVQKDARAGLAPARWEGLGPTVAVPMVTKGGVRGVLLLARHTESTPFSEEEMAPLLGFAGQAALAMELAERRRGAEQMSLLEDRDRIARDLHDLAIQRLFATGMTLQSAQRFVQHPEAAERLQRAVNDLDTTIKIIRSTIFGLRVHEADETAKGLRVRTARAVEESVPSLGFTPSLRMEGLVDTDVPAALADQVVAVLVEALTNVARHAAATSADVSLVVGAGRLTLTVTDNGRGISQEVERRSGLRNLTDRARNFGGDLELRTGPSGGTGLVWWTPLSAPTGARP
jgi:signal transduction histidine kinase